MSERKILISERNVAKLNKLLNTFYSLLFKHVLHSFHALKVLIQTQNIHLR